MIESSRYMGMPHFIRGCFTQMKYAFIAGIEPVPEAVEGGTKTLRESHYIAIKSLETIKQFSWGTQIIVIEVDDSHGSFLCSVRFQ
jgi:hypothetical protein